MVTIYKTDMDPSAQSYIRNGVHNTLRPYTSGNAPPNTNTGRLTSYPYDPPHSYPSRYIKGPCSQQELRTLMIALASNYYMLGRGNYGLRNTDSETNREWYTGTGSAYFALSGVNNGIASASGQGVPMPGGGVNHARASDIYGHGWAKLQQCAASVSVDLTVCHSSCHTSCHGSRGRR